MRKLLLSLSTMGALSGAMAFAEGEVNIYTLRQPELLQPILDSFTKDTGIKVNATWVQDGILARLQAEGDKSPADAVITVDISRLSEIAKAGLFQSIDNDNVNSKVDAHLRNPDGLWFGLTKRDRVIVGSKERIVKEDMPKSYEDLADPKWKGEVCIRSGKHVYNIGVISSMIAAHGEEGAKQWLTSVKDNLARKPTGNDRAQARAIYEDACDIALINSYYLGKMATNDKEVEQKDWYNALNIVFPNQDDRGAHVNISGMGILKSAKNKDNAVKFLEFMLSDDAQKYYAALNYEFPVVKNVEADELVQSWGSFKEDTVSLQTIADNAAKASQLVDETRFDF
ncbi:MAG: Fe(3+) ABC transporter substrate-binding protein [Alphaproteobacteria bacterium]